MALERLSLGGSGPSDGGGGKAARLPRWTRQEILVLIQGKRVAANRVRRGRGEFGSGQVEPKWASVASYCKKHGVNRGPVQCRKRWSNLAGDFKKIKEWESREGGGESFWAMRNDLRRERKLPGFFDREVYEILDGGGGEDAEVGGGLSLELAPPEAVLDSGRSAAADDGMFSDFEQSGQEEGGRSSAGNQDAPDKDMQVPIPISVGEEQFPSIPQESPGPGTNTRNQRDPDPEEAEAQTTQERSKRKRNEEGKHEHVHEHEQKSTIQLIEVLEKNEKLLRSHLESQSSNLGLDREQRNSHVNSLIGVLDKVADALGRIADKL